MSYSRASDWWFGVKVRIADRVATDRCRSRARMYGELFTLTGGLYLAGWPARYLSEFVDGEENAESD